MEVNNYIKCRKSSAIYSYYMYVDTWERKGDRIFDDYNLKLKLTDDIDDGIDIYQLVDVRVRKKDEEKFLEALSKLPNRMLLTGFPDYNDYCSGIVPFFEELELKEGNTW